jgi:lysophospholipase L1-like esterase
MPPSLVVTTRGRASLIACVALVCLSHRPACAQAAAPAAAPVAAANRWEAQIAAYEARGRDRPPAPGGICLLGSSNIRLWATLETDFPGMNVVNRGVGGCLLAELADFGPRLVAAARPRVIVVSAGSNDVHAGATAVEVRDAFARLVVNLRRASPDVTIAFLAIAPSISRWKQIDRQRAANEAVRAFIASAKDARLHHLDASAAFLGPDGRPDPACFVEDLLHPSVAGNARRAAILRPAFADLLRAADD